MAQKTNLNISPYYDDFDEAKDFYRVLFKPGFPVQARELTTSQSILQNQIESFGNHIFKEGSMVLPGSPTFDIQANALKIESIHQGVDVSIYINNFIGKNITGQLSGVTASIDRVAFLTDSDDVTNLTLYVKYSQSGDDGETEKFIEGESLFSDETVVFGNTSISSGSTFATTISESPNAVGSTASVDEGVYFIRGTFVNVAKQTIILDHYTNTPSYRVGLQINETLVQSKDDESLFDNAKGFTNFSAPGADRLKITTTLTKKLLTDLNDTNFVEILRLENGAVKKVAEKTVYSNVRDYFAERTFDESGHYAVDTFDVDVVESLNDRLGNDGIFLKNEKTDDGNDPSDDLFCVQVSPGKAYVSGYDVKLDSAQIIDVEKPRTTETVESTSIPFEMGDLLIVNNVEGAVKEHETIKLFKSFDASGNKIGEARVYGFNLRDAAYSGDSTQWDLYLYDIQTYTKLTLNRNVVSGEIPQTSFIQGKSSGASGYAVSEPSSSVLTINQTSGTFINGEQITVSGIDIPLTIKETKVFSIDDVKSLKQNGVANFPTFKATCVQDTRNFPDGISDATISNGDTLVSPGKLFSDIKEGQFIIYQTGTDTVINGIGTVSADLKTLILDPLTPSENITGVINGNIVNGTYSNLKLATTKIRNAQNSYLYANLGEKNVSSVNLSNSNLVISQQIDQSKGLTVSNNSLSFNLSSVSAGITSAFFMPFDQERYSVHYSSSDGSGIGTITSDTFSLDGNVGIITNLTNTSNAVVLNTTLQKEGIQSKVKEFTRSTVKVVNLSSLKQSGINTENSIVDGLTHNPHYGLRVQDEDISLNLPDVSEVLAVYESTDLNDPILTRIEFSSISAVDTNALIGENIIGQSSGAVARIVQNSSSSATPTIPSNNLGIIYLNSEEFEVGEDVIFKDTNIISTVQSKTEGKFNDITNNYVLDKGQRDQFYDYSRLTRINSSIPKKRLLIVFDHFTVPSSDDGDVFTVLSYDSERYSKDIPRIGKRNVRASDVLDFRPRVSEFTSTSASPFDFTSRNFTSDSVKFSLKSGENSLLGYEFYLPRIDRVYLDKFSNVVVQKGVPSKTPKPPSGTNEDMMRLGEIILPAYLYNVNNAIINLDDNRRYTMRDIGSLEDRIQNLERVTSLSLLELNTSSLMIEDSEGNNRFKSGFFVDDFNDETLSDVILSNADIGSGLLRPKRYSNSVNLIPLPKNEKSSVDLDLSEDYKLLDTNVQKTGNFITLKYKSIDWIEQKLATKVENVNPFHVIEYVGNIKLKPNNDTWTRTVQLPNKIINETNNIIKNEQKVINRQRNLERTRNITGNENRTDVQVSVSVAERSALSQSSTTNVSTSSRTVIVSSGDEKYIRSRNVEFIVKGLKPFTRHYHFLDGHSNVNFVPKLVQIATDASLSENGSSNNSFKSGETVKAYNGNKLIGVFRLSKSNHQNGNFKIPEKVFDFNPYDKNAALQSSYSQSSSTINIDLESLASTAQSEFYGYLKKGAQLVGQSSKAQAFVKELKLVSDNHGTIKGCFFIKDPYSTPIPDPRILTGAKTFTITSSKENNKPLPGSTLISSAKGTYTARGNFITQQLETTIVTTITTVNLETITRLTTTTTTTTITERRDPLAQSFSVGADIQAPNAEGFNDDDRGVFLTKAEIFVANKPKGNHPLIVQIRTMELGTPTLTVIGDSVELDPEDIQTSDNGEVATEIVFPTPIFLAPGQEYALVLLAPTTKKYEVWTAKMGQKTVNTQTLPDAESVRYSKQFAIGSLFKSQNGSIWTPAQKSDLKFKLYKAEFITDTTGVAYFGNTPLLPQKASISLVALPKKLNLGISKVTDSTLVGILTTGRRISGQHPNTFGTIESVGGEVETVGITTGGSNYNDGEVDTFNIIGKGSGLKLNITTQNGAITSIGSTPNSGNGYKVGDVVGIVTSSVSSNKGRNALITINAIDGIDTLYLTDVQGKKGDTQGFKVGAGLSYYSNSNTIVSLASTTIKNRTSEGTGLDSGNYLQVNHFNHGMYAKNNKLKINNIASNATPTTLSSKLKSTNSSSVSVASTTGFETFEGLPVSSTNKGYIIIHDEIIEYDDVLSNSLKITARGVDNTVEMTHDNGSIVQKYEFGGISLRRINNVSYDISDDNIQSNQYYIEVDRSNTYGVDRQNDSATSSELSFNERVIGGGEDIEGSFNIVFNEVNPNVDAITPGSEATIESFIRTTTGTSISGNEVSFTSLNKIEPVQLNNTNKLSSTRIISSRENELLQTQFENVSGRRSFTSIFNLKTTNKNLSPIIFLNEEGSISINCSSNNINSPVDDYSSNLLTNTILYDPHEAVYVSNIINLAQPASSLKVLLTAMRPPNSDIRVLYALEREDSTSIDQYFELFPGYSNLESSSDGSLKVVDSALNDGTSDYKLPFSQSGEFFEYEFSADNLTEFVGFRIKIVMSSTDQSNVPIIRDLRTIALQ